MPQTAQTDAYYVAGKINELTSWSFTMTLMKPDGAGGLVPITAAELQTLTLTLYNLATLGAINSIIDVDIKNTGRGSLHVTSGELTVVLHDADNPIVVAGDEVHVALVEATYNGGADSLRQEVIFTMRALGLVGP